jgi:hypothetical protein
VRQIANLYQVASGRCKRMRPDAGTVADMIRIDALWLAVHPQDMRSVMDNVWACMVGVFGSAKPHTACLSSNRRANRLKAVVHDGVGIGWRRVGCTRVNFLATK